MKIAICVPHTGTLKAETAQCLAGMMFAIGAVDIVYNGELVRPEADLLFGGMGTLEYKRANLALAAIEVGSDYLLWIDSDQTFGRDALIQLMRHDKPIVGGNYLSRHAGHPTAIGMDGQQVHRRSGIESVAAVGLGFCLMKTPILKTVPVPWFASVIGSDGRMIRGEDVHFCAQARSVGIPVYVDHDLEVGHIAEQVLKLEREDSHVGAILPEAGT